MDELDFLDLLILDNIQRYGALRDVELSRHLQCSRSLLLDRLELLCQADYVSAPRHSTESRYQLTQAGQERWVPLKYFHAVPAELSALQEEEFDWTPLYLPQPGWLDE